MTKFLINQNIWVIISALIFTTACAQQKKLVQSKKDTLPVAFPGAKGFGKFATGGRGGEVVLVTNLNDDGDGSFRKAVQKNSAKIIVFTVSGTIHLASPLNIKGNTTIAGQTAPGDGICIADYPVKISGDNVIIRYMRFRMGDRFQNIGKVHGAGHDDALSAYKRKHIIIDHRSMSWSTDEVFSVYGGDSSTLQWNIIAEPLNYSYHFEKGSEDFQEHGYGGIWGGKHLTAHHNLFAHCVSRNPRFEGIRNINEEFIDFSNNVIYNWGHNNVYGGEGGRYNMVNNYYKYGPSTKKNVMYRVANPSKQAEPLIPYGKYFIAGNYVDGSPEVTANNWLGVTMGGGGEGDKETARLTEPIRLLPITVQTAKEAFDAVMLKGGASYKRDTLDQRIIQNVKDRTGRFIDVQGGFPHGTPYEQTVSAWPSLSSQPAPADSDSDGMPDDWERKNGLNPARADDASTTTLHPFYTNIEMYINSLVSPEI